jgi:hypothetical protein
MVPWAQFDESVVNTPANQQLAKEAADQSLVLLKVQIEKYLSPSLLLLSFCSAIPLTLSPLALTRAVEEQRAG